MAKLTTTSATRVSRALAAAIMLAVPSVSGAQSATPSFAEVRAAKNNPFGALDQQLSYLGKDGTPTQRGVSTSEILRGNGSRAGYMLSHGGIIPNSVSVSVGVRSLRQNVDYYLDPVSGSIGFAEPVRRMESIRVSYRYVEGQDGNRSPLGLTGMSLNFKGSSVSLGFGISSGSNGLDFNTYGLALNSKFGQGSSLNGLFYVSTPADNKSNLVGQTRSAMEESAKKASAEDNKTDHLIVQNLTLKSGAANFRATYQDVGQHFSGFQAMKQSNAKNADALAQLTALEKEKGVKRLGFGAGLDLSKTSSFGLNWDQIGDGKDHIVRQGIGFKSGGLQLQYNQQSVGNDFARFNDLKEGERGQWAKEKGVKRSDLTLGFTGGKGSALGFSQSSFGDASGKLDRQAITLSGKGFNFAMTDRSSNADFGRIKDLTDAEKTALALDIRKQFNPNAAPGDVTAKDKEQIALDAGLKRSQMALSTGFGKTGKDGKGGTTVGFNQFRIGDGDGEGEISRRALSLAGKGFSVNYLDQSISETFGRLGKMSDFEKSMFANEAGIHRTSLGLNLTLSKTSTFAFSQLGLSDKEGGMSRQSFAYAAKGLDFKLNLAETDKGFARAKDLAGTSDADKAAIEAERGYKRTDWSANFTGVKGLNLSTYIYGAHNAEDKLDKNIFRHNLVWTGTKGVQFNYLTEGNRFDKEGTAWDSMQHTLMTLDHQFGKGMKLNLLRDTVSKISGGKDVPTVTTEFYHFETDRSKPNNLLAETKRIDLGEGKFENTTQIDFNRKLSKAMTIRYNKLTIDRGEDPSADTDTLQWGWQLNKGLAFNGLYAETSTNNETDATVKQFSLTGALTKQFNLTGSYAEADVHGKNVKAVTDIALSNAKPMNLLGMKEVLFTAKYAAVNDKQKTVSENAGAKLTGVLAKNQLCVEYGNVLNPNGTAAITRSFSLVSDRNAKKAFHCDILYKARNVNRNEVQLVRKYNLDLRLDKLSSVTYTYTSLPEDAAGNMAPTKTAAFALKRTLSKTLNLAVDYATADDYAKKTCSRKLGALVTGKVDKLTAIEVGYSVDITDQDGQHGDYHTLRLAYDRQVDGDHFVTVSTTYKMGRGSLVDDIQANLDLKTRF